MNGLPCAKKYAWATFDLAEGHRLLLLAKPTCRDGETLKAYRCSFCGEWHVGHSSRPRVYSEPSGVAER